MKTMAGAVKDLETWKFSWVPNLEVLGPRASA